MVTFGNNFDSPKAFLSSLIDALQEEYEEARRCGSGASYKLIDGVFISKAGGRGYIYRFRMPKIVSHLIPDTQVNIKDASGNTIRGEVLSVDGDTLTLFLEDMPSSKDVEMNVDLTFLILELKKKLIAYRDHYKDSLSPLPLQVFLYKPVKRDEITLNMDNRILSILDELNENQKSGITQSLLWSVAAIWGPPGTGKTKVLAYLAIMLALSGFKILITSYTHAALDRILSLIKHLQQKGDAKCKDLLIIRLGKSPNPEVQMFEEDQYIERWITEEKEGIIKEIKLYEEVLKTWHENKDKIISSAYLLKNLLERIEEIRRKYEQEVRELLIIIEQLRKNYTQLSMRYQQVRRKGPSILDMLFFRNWKERKQKILIQLQAEIRKTLKHIEMHELKIREYEKTLSRIEQVIKIVLRKIEPLTIDCIRMLSSYTKGIKKTTNSLEALNIISSNREWLHIFCYYGGETGLLTRIDNLRNELSRKLAENLETINELRRMLRLKANIIACTLTKCATELFDQVFTRIINCFDMVLIDECSMVNLGYIWVASSIAKRAVLFGDPKQLPPITLLDSDSEYGALLSTDIFSWTRFIENNSIPNSFLNRQYRMGRKICNLVSNLFYDGKLISETDFDGEIIFYDTTGLHAKDRKTLSKSRVNILNAFVILKICKDLLKEGYSEEDVAIVTPYRDQHHVIREILYENNLRNTAVGTIHTFQGSERRVVIVDLVRTSAQGFLSSPLYYKSGERLLATAMSRAVEKLIVIGPYNEVRNIAIPILSSFAHKLKNDSIRRLLLTDILPFKPEKIKITISEQFFLSENEVLEAVIEDIKNAKKYVVIISPYINEDILRRIARDANVPITVYTREKTLRGLSQQLLNEISSKVIIMSYSRRIHLKAIIIDDHILYDGSMNFLSPTGSLELVTRYDSYKNPKLWRLKTIFQPLNIRK